MVVRMKKPAEVRALGDKLGEQLMAQYEARLKENRLKQIEIMRINHENECALCGQVYNMNVSQPKACGGKPHQPQH